MVGEGRGRRRFRGDELAIRKDYMAWIVGLDWDFWVCTFLGKGFGVWFLRRLVGSGV